MSLSRSISYLPWQAPVMGADIVGQASAVNPMRPVSPFRGGAAITELGVHGVFDSPEDTAQTAPSVVSFEHARPDDAAGVGMDVLHNSLHKFLVYTRPGVDDFTDVCNVRIATAVGTKPGGNASYGAGILLTNVVDKRALVSVLPSGAQSTCVPKTFNAKTGAASYMTGVLVDHIHSKTTTTCRSTLAVEHAVEIDFSTNSSDVLNKTAGCCVWFT